MAFMLDGDGRLKGIATVKQVELSLEKGMTRAEETVQENFVRCALDTTLEQCLQLVAEGDAPVAVLDKEQRLLGVITRPALIVALQSGDGANDGK